MKHDLSERSRLDSKLFIHNDTNHEFDYIQDFDMENEPKEEKQFKLYIRKMTELNLQNTQLKNKMFLKDSSSNLKIEHFEDIVEDYENGVIQEFEDSPRIKLNTLIKSDSIKNYNLEEEVIKKLEK